VSALELRSIYLESGDVVQLLASPRVVQLTVHDCDACEYPTVTMTTAEALALAVTLAELVPTDD